MEPIKRILLFTFFHLLAWNRSDSSPMNNELTALYHNPKLPPPNNIKNQALNFAEGGSHNVNTLESTEIPLERTEIKNKSSTTLSDLLSGVPLTSTSLQKTETKQIVARKGVCFDDNSPNCPPIAHEKTESQPPPVYEIITPDNQTSTLAPDVNSAKAVSIISSPTSTKTIEKTPVTTPTPIRALKPTLTIVPADSDQLFQSMKNDRNIIVPEVALVCVPILVLILLFIYTRIQEARGNAQYAPMGFLVEDIYHD